MHYILNAILSIIVITFCDGMCKKCESSTNISEEIEIYKKHMNTSVVLEKQDKLLVTTWIEDLQVKQVNITSAYRLQMTRHKTHNFRRNINKKWQDCIDIYENQIKKSERQYYDNEKECLKIAVSEYKEKQLGVQQIEKEIRKWRKGYRYLQRLCQSNFPENEVDICLIEYMQRDSYNQVIERLLLLKLETMGELYKAVVMSAVSLEGCLKARLSDYVENVRSVMKVLNICYERTKNTQ